jgi:hypothetical protein
MARALRTTAVTTATPTAVLLLAVSCSSGPRSSGAPSDLGQPAGSGLFAGPPTEANLRAVADTLAEREGCEDTCCLGEVPAWVIGVNPLAPDAQYAGELRAIVDRTGDPRVRALALQWLAQALDVRDMDRMARFVGSTEAVGQRPAVWYTQQMQRCYAVAWKPATLGDVSLAALSAVTGQSFADARAFHAWRAQTPDPLGSIEHWERVLGRATPAPPALLARLRGASADLYAKVLLTAWGNAYGAGEAEIVRAAREIVGQERLLRMLGGEELWPELSRDEQRFARFAAAVLRRAEAIFERRHAAALVRLWEQGALGKQGYARALLAVAAGRFHEADRCRILTSTLEELTYGQELLEDLARRCTVERADVLRGWFYGPKVRRGDMSGSAAAILRGLQGAGAGARPALKSLVRADQPLSEEPEVTEALVRAAVAAGCPDAFPRLGEIRPRDGKNMYRGDGGDARWEVAQAEAEAARRDCVGRVIAWLASR